MILSGKFELLRPSSNKWSSTLVYSTIVLFIERQWTDSGAFHTWWYSLCLLIFQLVLEQIDTNSIDVYAHQQALTNPGLFHYYFVLFLFFISWDIFFYLSFWLAWKWAQEQYWGALEHGATPQRCMTILSSWMWNIEGCHLMEEFWVMTMNHLSFWFM